MNLQKYAEHYRRELFESVIPFWTEHSPDPEYGGYFTCLDRQGDIYDTRKYVWMQGRAAWTFARLYNQVEQRPEWLAFSRSCVEFLRKHARDEQGRCYFSLTRDGRPAGYQRKPYAAVFMSLGLIEYAKASGDRSCLQEGIDLYELIAQWIAAPELLGRPLLGGAPALDSLADVMVLTSLALEIAAVDPAESYRALLRDCLKRALGFYDRERRIFMEFNGDSRSQFPEQRLACPGSSLEVAWFLLHIMEALEEWSALDTVLQSIEGALDFGWDREYGGLYYFIDTEGRPPMQLEANMKLWWPQTEALYALVLARVLTGDSKWDAWLERVHNYTFDTFPDPEHGEWFGYCDRRGQLSHTLKGNNYKGCFHVPRALLFSFQRIEGARKSPAREHEAKENPKGGI